MRCGEFLLSFGKEALGFFADGLPVHGKPLIEPPLFLPDFSHGDDLVRDTAQTRDEPEFLKRADAPLGGVELPRLYAVAVVVLKLMVKVVVPLAEGEEGHEPAVLCGALG